MAESPSPATQNASTQQPWWRDLLVLSILGVFCVLALLVSILLFSSYRYSKYELAIRQAEQQDNLPSAIDDLQSMIEISDPNAQVHWRTKLGRAYLQQQDYEKALEQLSWVRENAPERNLDRDLMIAWFETGRTEKAQDAMQKVLTRLPQDPAANYYRGRLLLDQGNPRQAAQALRICSVTPTWDERARPYRQEAVQQVFQNPPSLSQADAVSGN